MKTLFISLLAVAICGYASAQNTDYSSNQNQHGMSGGDTSVSAFIIKALKSSEMEIEAGRLAQQRAQSTDVKAYGSRMIADHTKASDELRPIALKRKVDLSVINSQGAPGSGAKKSGTNVQDGTATASGTTANTSTGTDQTTRSAGTAATTGNTTGTTANTSSGNNQTTRSAGTTGTTTNTGTTGNTSGNDQTTRSAGTTGTAGTATSGTSTAKNNASGNANNTTSSGNTTSTGNNANYDSNSKASGQAMTDTVVHASHEQKLNILKQQSGADFDRQYMQMMVNDHIKAVKMFEKASTFSDAEVKAFAIKNLPVLREHLASAQTILSSLESTNQSGKKSGNQ